MRKRDQAVDRHYANHIIVREGELVCNGKIQSIWNTVISKGKINNFPSNANITSKSDLDIKHAKINIWKREIRPDHNVKSYFNEKQRKTNNFLDTGK